MTNAGASLLARAMAEGIAIDFKSIVVGDGSYTNEEKAPAALKQRTALKSLQVAYEPSSLIRQGNAVRLSALITNVDPSTHEAIVTSGFYINEIGIMAQPSDEATAPILFSISVTVGTRGDYMPAYTGDNPAQIVQGYVTAVSNDANVTLSTPVVPYALAADLTELAESKGQPNGIATLDSGGRIPYSQLPESAMEYKGTWNASTNTPTITEGVGTNGDFYIVSVAGTWNGQAFSVDDRIIFDGALEEWHRLGAGSVIDNLNSTSSTSALSANQGRVLNEKIGYGNLIEDDDEYMDKDSYSELSNGWHRIYDDASDGIKDNLPSGVLDILADTGCYAMLFKSVNVYNGSLNDEMMLRLTVYVDDDGGMTDTERVVEYFYAGTSEPTSSTWIQLSPEGRRYIEVDSLLNIPYGKWSMDGQTFSSCTEIPQDFDSQAQDFLLMY